MIHLSDINPQLLFHGVLGGLIGSAIVFICLSLFRRISLPSHRLAPHRLWYGFWESDFGFKTRQRIAVTLFYLGFIPTTCGYSNGYGEPPDIEAAGWLTKNRPDEMSYMSFWFPLPLQYLRDKEGKLREEYWK